jgi:hypothetical protein
VKEPKRTEEQQKDYIFELFSKCRSEIVSDQLQGSSVNLCKEIYYWYKDYLSVDVTNMGLGLVEVIIRFTKNISKIPKDKDGFFKYLTTSIKREKISSYYEFDEKSPVNIPIEKKKKLKEVKGFIRMKESQLGRELTSDEKIQGISKWFKKQEYLDLLNLINIGSISHGGNNGNSEIDIIDTYSLGPLGEYISKINTENVLEAVTSVLAKKQEKTRPCIKALFTLYCIKHDLKGLYPILDQEIIDSFHKHDKKPKQYEIYLKYHPETDKESAEAMASTNLREFLNDLETYLKKKNY